MSSVRDSGPSFERKTRCVETETYWAFQPSFSRSVCHSRANRRLAMKLHTKTQDKTYPSPVHGIMLLISYNWGGNFSFIGTFNPSLTCSAPTFNSISKDPPGMCNGSIGSAQYDAKLGCRWTCGFSLLRSLIYPSSLLFAARFADPWGCYTGCYWLTKEVSVVLYRDPL